MSSIYIQHNWRNTDYILLFKVLQRRQSVSTVAHYKTIDVKSQFKIFQSKKWHLGFYSIQTEMLNIQHNTQWLIIGNILFHFEFKSCIYIYIHEESCNRDVS